MENLLAAQNKLFQEITNLLKTDPTAIDVDEKWVELEKNHNVLKNCREMASHAYIQNNIFGSLRKDIEEARSKTKKPSDTIGSTTKKENPIWDLGNELDQFINSEVAETLQYGGTAELKKVQHRLRGKLEKIKTTVEMVDKSFTLSKYYEHVINKLNDAMVDVEIKMLSNSTPNKEEDYRLPKMEIPKFYGEQNKWVVFSDLFKELVHNRKDLSDTKKFQYLKLSLGGNALKSVHHMLDGSSSDYRFTWETLESRYENDRKLLSENIEAIISLPKLKEEESELKSFIDTVNESVHIIKKKGECGAGADTILAQLIMRKFERSTMYQYDQLAENPRQVQGLQPVLDFLERLYATVSSTASSSKQSSSSKLSSFAKSPPSSRKYENVRCCFCKLHGHSVLVCRKFKAEESGKRIEFVKKNMLCNICLMHDSGKSCSKDWLCGICKKPHNTLLHTEVKKISVNMTNNKQQSSALFATAIVKIKNREGHPEYLRALIDCAAEQSSISEEAAQLLRLPRVQEATAIGGMTTNMTDESTTRINIEILSTVNQNFNAKLEVLVISNLNKILPKEPLSNMRSGWGNIQLADPNFDKPSRIDLVIGLDMYPRLITEGIKKNQDMLAQNTVLGWIVCGGNYKTTKSVMSAVTTINLSELNRFWEMDETEEENSVEANACENHFKETAKVSKDNRYVVQIPFKEDNTLGNSRKQAMARLFCLEKQFIRRPELKESYVTFMNEYINLGHMKAVKSSSDGYFLPHQAVIRESSLTTKLRVVFDASAKTTNGRSLNDVMMVGPKQQKDIFDILLKWRLWKYVISADIEKMYRQIWIANEQQKYQQILWRDDPSKRVQQYKLTTVTYGTAAAPFLATRVLIDIAERAGKNNEKMYSVIKDDFYMDDLLTGASTIEECRTIQTEVSSELNKFGLNLRKWVSNNHQIINNIDSNENNMIIQIEENESVKTLGLQWDPKKDVFFFKITIPQQEVFTKRMVLSTLAKIFDPLGWLSPVIVTGKLFIQKLWVSSLSWDAPLSETLRDEFVNYISRLQQLDNLQIPRWLYTTSTDGAQLHGFSDASDSAYAAAVYVKTNGRVTFLTSKTKVNPIKNRKTIPKLELCGAHLLAKLLAKVVNILNWCGPIYGWCDSQITLAWIVNNKSKEKFVRRRVDDIQKHCNISWRFVKSEDNPADAASRGVKPEQFINSNLWWNGPSWLTLNESEWPIVSTYKEIKIIAATCVTINLINDLINKYSSLNKLERVVAYILRFIDKLKCNSSNTTGYLTSEELKRARLVIIKNQQSIYFGIEISHMKKGKSLDIKHKLLQLNPFLDKNDILRVGGRLQNSALNYNEKHPIILNNSHLAGLIIDQTHRKTLHGGITLMKVNIRRSYWIIGLKNMLKSYVRKCVTCIRYKQEAVHQIMGNLPESRVLATHPFVNSGVDYAGPISIKCSKGRGQKTYKGYVAVFVCMATRCLHLELVSDLTSDAFMAALKRFFSRRGRSSNVYSDNGTNFVGASKILQDDLKKAIKNNNKLAPTLEAEGTKWHFIPPAAPHFGGIWEAGVKSFKFHLKRVVGDTILTYEEMSTLLTQIEAVLNSRPMYATGDDVDDIDVLTPGHFLIGRPMLSSPESMLEDRLGSLDRWKLIQKMRRDFWKRWKEEYLNSLQQRSKWKKSTENLKEGQIVLIKNENTPPTKWPIGQVVDTNAGTDGKVRVIEIKTQGGLIKRAITKVCPLQCENKIVESNSPVQNAEVHTRPRTRQSKTNMSLVMMTLLLIGMVLTAGALDLKQIKNKTMVKEIKNNTAIYLDPINQINIASSSWNLVVYYEMKPYFDVLSEASLLVERSKLICPRLQTFEEQCWTVLRNIQYQVDKIDMNNKLLLKQESRVKRGSPLNFVGSFYHIIFGLMDDDDRQAMENNMKNLLANQNDLKQLAKKQTSVVDSTVNLLKRTTEEVNSNFQGMKANIENINVTMNQHYFVYRESIRFFMITKQIHDLIDECNEVQREAIDLLLDVNHGKVHPALISPQQLQAEIVKIRDALPDKYVLPGRHTGTELKDIWHLLTGTGIFVGSQLVIDLKIPLFSRQASQFYRIIPVPFRKGDGVLIAKIKSPYLVYNYELDSYHYLSQAELNECKKTLNNQIVCEENFPWIAANSNECELSPIKPHTTLNCLYDEVDEMAFWIELRNKGNWLFKIFQNTSAHIKCSTSQQLIFQLPNQGILTLEEDCTVRVGEITLVATHSLRSKGTNEFHNFLTKDVSPDDSGILKPLGNVVINHAKEIEELKGHIENLKKEDISLRGLTFYHLSGHAALGISTIVVIVILVYAFYQLSLRRRLLAIQFNSPRQNVQN